MEIISADSAYSILHDEINHKHDTSLVELLTIEYLGEKQAIRQDNRGSQPHPM